jgi:hypothetical protein
MGVIGHPGIGPYTGDLGQAEKEKLWQDPERYGHEHLCRMADGAI